LGFKKEQILKKIQKLTFTIQKKRKMQRITNIFPLLEEHEAKESDSTPFDIQLAHSRIVWLNRSSKATQEEFALKLMNEEPQGEAFDATVATILTMDDTIREKWLDLEITVAAKKIEANMAHIKKFYLRYSIAIAKPRRGEETLMYKFPHEQGWSETFTSELSAKLAKSGFPLVPAIIGRYNMGKRVTAGAARLVEEALNGQTSSKRTKVAP
jgi:hypothetical protein